MIKETFLMSCE